MEKDDKQEEEEENEDGWRGCQKMYLAKAWSEEVGAVREGREVARQNAIIRPCLSFSFLSSRPSQSVRLLGPARNGQLESSISDKREFDGTLSHVSMSKCLFKSLLLSPLLLWSWEK